MGVSSPTGNGEKRGPESATPVGNWLGYRPDRARKNDAASEGTHDMDSARAADGRVDMRDDGRFTRITVATSPTITNNRADKGEMDMRATGGSPMQLKGKMNR